jgi:hypothetical protein
MKVQWYADDKNARIFHSHVQEMIADLPDCESWMDADQKLRYLGLKRRTKWQETEWGFEATIRRISQ